MFDSVTVLAAFCVYVAALFLVARWAERRGRRAAAFVNSPLVYSLSLAVYATTWTFYGCVGMAASSGMLFLAYYLGPTLGMVFGWTILRKLIRLKNARHITSIADLLACRYGKSQAVAGLAAVMAIVGSTPYLALQLKAVASTFLLITTPAGSPPDWIGRHVGAIVVGLLTVFTIMFGARRLDPTERHPGMMAAVAVESLVKLAAFLSAGIFVTFRLFDGFGDVYQRLAESPFRHLADIGGNDGPSFAMWTSIIAVTLWGCLFLPRQFHVAVVENSDERHIKTAVWVLPAYFFLISMFILPIAAGSLLKGLPPRDADTFVLRLPLLYGSPRLALLVFLGGFSAATSMIMVASMAMATMATNHLLLPIVDKIPSLGFLRRNLLQCRWAAIAGLLGLAYWFERQVGYSHMLGRMGIISFVAILQFAPAVLGGISWRRGNRVGALLGLGGGFVTWGYTLFLPALVRSGALPDSLLRSGPAGFGFLNPERLFDMGALEPVPHAVFWTLAVNAGLYVVGSLLSSQSETEREQAAAFVEALDSEPTRGQPASSPSHVRSAEKRAVAVALFSRYFSRQQAEALAARSLRAVGLEGKEHVAVTELAALRTEVETALAGALGAAAAHRAVRRSDLVTPMEARELSEAYAEILANLSLSPEDLKKKVDYYQEKAALLARHSEELLQQVEEREGEIRARERVEAALRENQARYDRLATNAPGLVFQFALRPDGTTAFLFVNEACRTLFGVDPEEARQDSGLILDLVHPEDRDGFHGAIRRSAETLGPWQWEGRGVIGREVRWFQGVAQPERQAGGEVVWDGLLLETTERRSAIEELARSHLTATRLATAVQQVAEGIFIADPEGAVEYVNPAFERITGHCLTEWAGRSMAALRQGTQAEFLSGVHQQVADRGVWTGRWTLLSKDQPPAEVECTISPVRGEAGGVTNFVGVLRDVTKERGIERRLAQSQRLEALGTLAGGIAHDFNNILTPIIGYAELISRDFAVGDRCRTWLGQILTGAERAGDLVRQILAFSRKGPSECHAVSVTSLLKEALKFVRASLPATITICQCYEAEDDVVLADPTQLHQVILNLCTNAARAMGETGGSLGVDLRTCTADAELACRHDGLEAGRPYVHMTVTDTGCGMPPEVMDRIFEPFFTTREADGGTGLGLAVVHGIVKGHGGVVEAQSEPGQGSAFHVFLPAAGRPAQAKVAVEGEIPRGTERILYVDDEEAVASLGRQLLEALGYRVTSITSSLEALELFRRAPHDFDLVITDETMPGLTGTALAAELRTARPDIRIILTSGFCQYTGREGLAPVGIREFVSKPFTIRNLAEAVRRTLN